MAGYADGVPCWVDAMLSDLEAGKRFYGELFGWTFRDGEKEYGYYTQAFAADGKNVAALSPKPDGRMPTVWNLYLASADAQATAARIREAGGQLVTEPMAVGSYGTMLMAADPGGAVFGVWQAGTHKGFEKSGEPGSYTWAEILTRDAERVDTFYETVFGYGSRQIGDGENFDYKVFAPEGKDVTPANVVLGRFRMGSEFPAELPAHYDVYFGVEDADRAAETIRRLGGRVNRGPDDSPFGRFAVVADDQGANFSIIDQSRTVGDVPA
ncbi:VOC family protein [Actinacidiphila soli]|jgi:predicted enzyme related to lactoylglutathione lyase|uniref:VOC family protein n=1 Tax=Actinacidiphila soli TaxID=2487275 RepID=UPI000FCAAF13|nr:VOC family protein [Actinacidiphila soli]